MMPAVASTSSASSSAGTSIARHIEPRAPRVHGALGDEIRVERCERLVAVAAQGLLEPRLEVVVAGHSPNSNRSRSKMRFSRLRTPSAERPSVVANSGALKPAT